MRRETSSPSSTRSLSSPTTRKYLLLVINLLFREWDRFAKGEYERLAMEEEGGDDSEMIDAMDGWDSDQDNETAATEGSGDAK